MIEREIRRACYGCGYQSCSYGQLTAALDVPLKTLTWNVMDGRDANESTQDTSIFHISCVFIGIADCVGVM